MILTKNDIKEKLTLIAGFTLLKYKNKKEFEIKIEDDFTGETLIIDNDFMNKKSLPLKDYIPLCSDIVKKLKEGIPLYKLSQQ